MRKLLIYPLIAILVTAGSVSTLFPASLQKNILSNSLAPLTTPTYEGSGQITHPDVLSFSEPWNGYRYWMVGTPFPDKNSAYENPSVLASNDGTNWIVPEGLSNPIAGPPAQGYLSDPDMIYHPSYGIRVYYRSVDESHNRIYYTQSKNVRDWTKPLETIAAPNHQVISPAVIRAGSRYIMYSVKLLESVSDTVVERRTSKDGIKWSRPKSVSMLDADEKVWHIDARYVASRKEFWMLFLGYPSSSLHLAVSRDGLRFNVLPVPLLSKNEDMDAWDSYGLYRSTFDFADEDEFLLWYTGIREKASHIGFIRVNIGKILSLIP